jgi:hypothetical protein
MPMFYLCGAIRSSGQVVEREKAMSNWWEDSVIRLRRRHYLPFTFEGQHQVTFVTFTKVIWSVTIWDEYSVDAPLKQRYVRGVPGTVRHATNYMFPAWRCSKCRAVFIVGDQESLHHECTEVK